MIDILDIYDILLYKLMCYIILISFITICVCIVVKCIKK